MVHRVPHKGRCPECGYEGTFYPGNQCVFGLPRQDGGSGVEPGAGVFGCPKCFWVRLAELVGPIPELEDLGPDPEGGFRVVPC